MNTGKRLLSLNLALLMAVLLLLPASKTGAAAMPKPAVAAQEAAQEVPEVKLRENQMSFAMQEDLSAELEQWERLHIEKLQPKTTPAAEITVKTAAVTPTVKIDGVIVHEGDSGAGWNYYYGNHLSLNGFQGQSIEVTGDLFIANSGVSAINAYGKEQPAISATGNLSINNYGTLNVYAWATATDLHSGIKAIGKIDIYNRGKMFVRGGSHHLDDENKAPGIDTVALTVNGGGGTFEAMGSPAVQCPTIAYDNKALNCFAGDSRGTAVQTTYQNQKYLRLEFVPIKLNMYGNGGILNGYNYYFSDSYYGAWIDSNKLPQFVYPGYVHIGWSTNQNGAGGIWCGVKKDSFELKSNTGIVDLYAQWQQVSESQRVLFSGQGGTFEDGRGAKAIGFEPGQPVVVPSITQLGAARTMLGWTEDGYYSPSARTCWAFPGDNLSATTDKDFYAYWQPNGEPYIRYEGGNGKSAGGSNKLYQTAVGTATNLELFDSATFTRSDEKVVYGWSTKPDGTGTRYLAETRLLKESLPKGETELHAVWGDPVSVSVALGDGNFPYTGNQISLPPKAVVTVKAGSTNIENPELTYSFYQDSTGANTLWNVSSCGNYYMRGEYKGDQQKWYPPAKGDIMPFTIGRGTAKILLPSTSPVALWTGQPATLPLPPVSMSGVPYTLETPSYEYWSENRWIPGLPSAVGTHQIRAQLPGTSNYNFASAEATLNISNFVAENGTVRGNVDLTVDENVTGSTTVLIALYNTATGRMNAVSKQEVTVGGDKTIALRNISLPDSRGDGDKVKIFLMDSSNILKPKIQRPYEYDVKR